MKYEDIDDFARKMHGLTMQGPIPSLTTHMLGARLVEMLDKVELLERKLNDGGPGVVHLLEATATERDELKTKVTELESAIRGLVTDGYDKDGPYTKNCVGCLACDIPFGFKHCEGCPVKPALDLVFGAKDADHCRYDQDTP